MTTTANEKPAGEWLRAHQIEERFPGLYSSTAWKSFLARGLIKSSKPAGSRARLVRVADVEAFLQGAQAAA